ncbi:class I SAM-dependent methyltransferase [Thiotrichales bacterium 19S9-12]|nr:class I SAM-dependent methyltransferase [Thiotrichales bacterium 19S9-11]MCF6811200.1 class I SAM-dependent methyltransferase [Thiotrichales bacterium 19S9-12]
MEDNTSLQAIYNDPKPIIWNDIDLPDSWSDQYKLKKPTDLFYLLKHSASKKRRRIELPETLYGKEIIPPYAQQEFHNLPNGNYSNTLATGYIKGFDIAMLGFMKHSRKQISQRLSHCKSALDLGTGGGRTIRAIYDIGIKDAWGIDISPYLLKQASIRNPMIQFIHAKAENLPFYNQRFDGVSACYLLHEVPPKYINQILDEAHRVLKKDGTFVIVEPSPIHYYGKYFKLLRQYGLKGIYFRFLSHYVHEPFVKSWHKLDFKKLLKEKSFEVVEEIKATPNCLWVARKR